MGKKKIVILGAGYGGLRALKRLQDLKPDAELILVNKHSYHCEKTALHEVATGAANPGDICYPVSSVVDPHYTTFIEATVSQIDHQTKMVLFDNHEALTYDYLLIALGFEFESFGIDGLNDYAYQITNIPSVKNIYDQLNEKLRALQPEETLSIVVGGAGFTSIEYIGELVEQLPFLTKAANIKRNQVKVSCIQSNVLPMFSPELSNYIIKKLEKKGVTFIKGRVAKITVDSVYHKLDRDAATSSIEPADMFVWAGGVRGSSVITNSNFTSDRGRVLVHKNLTVPDCRDVMMIGDCSIVMDETTGFPYPTTAQIAMQQADCAANNIAALLKGGNLKEFIYRPKGTVCSIGRHDAVGVVMGKQLRGVTASVLKKVIDTRSIVLIGGVDTVLKKQKIFRKKSMYTV
ncbi:NAD(P)/FAD-dependent oxidoreductase [Brochothrix campestris]|uniref:FAD/NAD(P)-binding domain-containing protein n=1 Tax=Brochothrix campestris FSL F6-1037 TaxID=1265861 RepID=W7CMT1_9LIST|nr:NAD(P)/FAD-dependent oxidoreductase [Brochothrix campestris]EUJ38367.1 hypothetical protein BCAMP_08876 [Brochothrix campestris FSL F6-1037]